MMDKNDTLWTDLTKEVQRQYENAVALYRFLHQMPQIGLQQYKTSKYVREVLSTIEGVQLVQPIYALPTAVIAKIVVEKADQSFLFRCELDALCFKEKSDLPYSSKNDLHHACGHDAHMSSMITAIKIIAQYRTHLRKNITFCFQPGEEGKGGASALLKAMPNLLDGIDHCFALHLGNHVDFGKLLIGIGGVTATTSRFRIEIEGKSAHSFCPNAGIDANYIGCQLVTQLYVLTHMKIPPLEGGTLTIMRVEGGSEVAKVSGNFTIKGSLRVRSMQSFELMKDQITSLANNQCAAYGAKCNVVIESGLYRPVINNEGLVNRTNKILMQLEDCQIQENQRSFAGEDFCQFSDRKPSCYITVGSALPNSIDAKTRQSMYPPHSPLHKINEECLKVSVKIWVALAFDNHYYFV